MLVKALLGMTGTSPERISNAQLRLDFVFVAIGVAAFAVTALYLNACARL